MRLKDEKFYKTVRDFLDIYLIKHRGYTMYPWWICETLPAQMATTS